MCKGQVITGQDGLCATNPVFSRFVVQVEPPPALDQAQNRIADSKKQFW